MLRRRRRWLYFGLYALLTAISMLPPLTELAYDSRDTSKVIAQLLSASIVDSGWLAPLFHLATLGLVLLIAMLGEQVGRLLAAYLGLNYLVIGAVQTMGFTPDYGFVIHTGALLACAMLAVTWIVVAIRGDLKPSLGPKVRRYLLLPAALLAFWSPFGPNGQPDLSLLKLLSAPDYGLTFCFTTPVFLYLLILSWPAVNTFALRLTAFNGLLYGLYNMAPLAHPETRWMGVMHLPLVILSLVALVYSARRSRLGPT